MYQRYLGPALAGLAVVVALGLAGIPVLIYLPFLILLACPLMHVSMLLGHGGHGTGHDGSGTTRKPASG